jgi:hypothetical protein
MEELSTEMMFCLDIGQLCESNEVSAPHGQILVANRLRSCKASTAA